MPARTVLSLDNLPQTLGKIFDQAQNTTANHQKNFVALHKLHAEAAAQHGSLGERTFEQAFLNMLGLVLPVKKGNSVADRIMRFIGGYTKFMNEKGEFFLPIPASSNSDDPQPLRKPTKEATMTTGTTDLTTLLPVLLLEFFVSFSREVSRRIKLSDTA